MSSGSIIALDLSLPDSVQFFAARPSSRHSKDDSLLGLSKATHPRRQKLRGKLRIVASHPTKVTTVDIKFLGHTELSWRDPLKSQHSILAERMTARKTLRKSKSTLLEEATLPAGVTELGFEITVPGYLYPTFKSKYLDIRYTVSAKVVPSSSKLAKKPIRAEKELLLEKTLMPKDVAAGQVAGYVVPRIAMRGSALRADCQFRWEFRVPKWISLDHGLVEFDGTIQLTKVGVNEKVASRVVGISKIEVDVVQQSFYHYEINNEDQAAIIFLTESPVAFSDRLTKRHLVISHNEPSIYLHPPLDTPITFSFPIRKNPAGQLSGKEYASHRVKSVPYAPNRSINDTLPASCVVDTTQYYAPSTTISKDALTFSLDSPFLEIRHFIRMIIYPATIFNDTKPICIGLPIQVTQNVSVSETEEDALPSYQSITRGAEALPDYDTSMVRELEHSETFSRNITGGTALPSEEIDLVDLYRNNTTAQASSEPGSNDEALSTLSRSTTVQSFGDTYMNRMQEQHVLIQERRLEDFWII